MESLRSGLTILLLILLVSGSCHRSSDEVTALDIQHAEKLAALQFTGSERDSMLSRVRRHTERSEQLHGHAIPNHIPPALIFNPLPPGYRIPSGQEKIEWDIPPVKELPGRDHELAFYDLPSLASLVRNRKISSVELTGYFIDRLREYDDTLHCLITMTEAYALQQAEKMDRELASGQYRGILHGIPYGIKDLFSFPGYPTTWGATPFQDQYIHDTATVIRKLEEAGAVMIAKLSMGALAMGDVWFGGMTRNPWKPEQGSSGSSAGSAAAVVAGLVPFTIGTETQGSIVSPSMRCGATGLRPTFGRVSRSGAMTLAWSMDKIGPICRSAYDCAIVFNAIYGRDEKDPSTLEAPFNYIDQPDFSKLRFAYLEDLFEPEEGSWPYDSATLETFRNLGAELVPVHLPRELPVEAMSIILSAESAAAFDQLTLTGKDDELVRQSRNAWPNRLRSSRFIPAVDYIQANRVRFQMISLINDLFSDFDVILAPTHGKNLVLVTNLTGHPCIGLPNGFNPDGRPVSISLLGNLFDEATILAVAKRYQEATEFEDRHPALFE